SLFDHMTPEDVAVVNRDDELTWPLAGSHAQTVGWSVEDMQGDALNFGGFNLNKSELPFSESHNFRNALVAGHLALAVLKQSGVNESDAFEAVCRGLAGFTGLGHRMERLGARDGVELINNSMCTNPAAVVASSESVSKPQRLLVGGIKKEYDFAPVREHLRSTGHRAYLFGRDAPQIAEELGGGTPVFTTMGEAFSAAVAEAKSGEVVMLAPGCASMDQFEDFRARGEEFKRLAKEWLQ
ncbi:MAG TPA: hypothetical protein VEX38_09530, partial [Fimbriimonadaceae bacterium]|nr:hypothetical protein [Fimbriimonadaceae bacterium]